MAELDLDAMEREAQSDLDIEGYRVLALIQRLREAEATDYFERAEHYESLYVAALNRIAHLERVREAADVARYLRRGFSQENAEQREAWRELDAALAAMEEK